MSAQKFFLDEDDLEDRDASYYVITNDGQLTFEVDRLYLSEEEENLKGLLIRNVTIAPGESYRLEVSGENALNIRKAGGTVVYLSNIKDTILDSVTVPALARDEIYTRAGAEWKVMLRPDLKEPVEGIKPPTFSAESGFYQDAFDLSLSAAEGLAIYYTTDGSLPTEESERYTVPIRVYDKSSEENKYRAIPNVIAEYRTSFKAPEPVDKAFVIRAICVDANGDTSEVVTQTYFVNLDKYKDRDVISLVADPEDLFGEKGIYVTGAAYDKWYQAKLEYEESHGEEDEYPVAQPGMNFNRKGRSWEKEANVEFFRDAVEQMNQGVGIRIQGASSRTGAMKRFTMYARKDYDDSKYFSYDIYENDVPIHSAVLRGGFINSFSQALVEDRSVATQQSLPVTVFLNGEFWYNTYLDTKYSEEFFSQKYSLSDDNILVMKVGYWGNASGEEQNAYNTTIKHAVNTLDLSNENDYKAFNQIMNIQSYIDFSCTNIYMANADVAETKNFLLWKTYVPEDESYGNTAWNWGVHDMDMLTSSSLSLYGYSKDAEYNTFADQGMWVGEAYNQGTIWVALKQSPIFCKDFVLTFMDLVNTNFSVENVSRLMDEWGEYTIESYDHGFFLDRATYIVPYMAEEFNLTGTQEPVTLSSNVSGAPILLNTIQPELREGRWTGSYFTDYPVTVTAAEDGFLRWEVTAEGNTQTYTDTTIEVPVGKGGVQIHAVFEPSL